MTNSALALQFFLQLAAILVVCRIGAWVLRRVGQPGAVGEMVAGVVLGPSVLGLWFPHVHEVLFPAATRGLLYVAAQIGLLLYMFTVGLEFRVDIIRPRLRSATTISLAGIAGPVVLGAALGAALCGRPGYYGSGVGTYQAALFMGSALAITAFPVLARIIAERRIGNTTAGVLSLAAGAIGDAAAWGILAFVLATLTHNVAIAALAIGGGALFVVALFTVVRPLCGRFSGASGYGSALIVLVLAGWFTDRIGLHAVFGAFFFGVAFPKGRLADQLLSTIEPLSVAFLLPLFFAYSGLNTRLDILAGSGLWLAGLAIVLSASIGKVGCCYAAARACGESPADAMRIGALMNSRGLIELILLNIGLERGVITPALFSLLVVMAIVTTFSALPLFLLGDRVGSQWVSPPAPAE